jgi:hypothetical protein
MIVKTLRVSLLGTAEIENLKKWEEGSGYPFCKIETTTIIIISVKMSKIAISGEKLHI